MVTVAFSLEIDELMNAKSLYPKEEKLILDVEQFLSEHKSQQGVCTQCGDYRNVLINIHKGYSKLFKQTVRLIKYSDRQQDKINRANIGLKQSQERLELRNQFIRQTFGRYMSDDVVKSILDKPEGLKLGGENKIVNIIMTDLRGFTALSGKHSPEEVVAMLNVYLEFMTEIILKYNGTIIEILGDAILILFGAPITRGDDAKRAVTCALEMQNAMSLVNKDNRERGLPLLKMGIGIHTGSVIVGNIGSQKRSKYAVVGTTVNLAARIESYTVGGQVLISEDTFAACDNLLGIESIMEVLPKGIPRPINVYLVNAIGGSYNVQLLTTSKKIFREIPGGLPMQFSILEGKHAGTEMHEGSIIWMSSDEAKMQTNIAVERFSNLKMTLMWQNQEISSEIFAKVTKTNGDTNAILEIAFTSVPSEAEAIFKKILESDDLEQRRSSRVPSRIPLNVTMEDGSILQSITQDFSQDGMFLTTTDIPGKSLQGKRGEINLEIKNKPHRFLVECVHVESDGLGVRIATDVDLFGAVVAGMKKLGHE